MSEAIEDGKFVELTYKVIDRKSGHVLSSVEFPLGYVHGHNEILAPSVHEELTGRCAGEFRELRTSSTIDQTIFEIDPDLRVGPFEKALDLTEEGFVHGLPVATFVASVRVISKNVETMIVVEIEQLVGKAIKRQPYVVEPVRQFLVNVV